MYFWHPGLPPSVGDSDDQVLEQGHLSEAQHGGGRHPDDIPSTVLPRQHRANQVPRNRLSFSFAIYFFDIFFDILDGDRDTIGSESVVSFDTAEQSFVSQSEVGGVTSELVCVDDNPERLALALDNNNTNNQQQQQYNNTNNIRLELPQTINNSAWFTNQFDHCLFVELTFPCPDFVWVLNCFQVDRR